MSELVSGESICITGGTGFLGSLLSKRLLTDEHWTRVAILSRDWHKQARLRTELGDPKKFRWFLGDICDRDKLKRAFNGIDVVIHAAAVKSVPDLEYNPFEAVRVNVVGTQNVIEEAIDASVKKALFISSDKCSAALNTYGKSKALAESLFIAANSYTPHGTKFSAARYPNVLGSAGSVLPIFVRQASSGKLTVTTEKMDRFWLTPEATVDFVLACVDRASGGEVFVPKNLEAAAIVDLAIAVAPDAEIEFVGMRPGEKTHEWLAVEEELSRTRDIEWAYRISPLFDFQGDEYAPAGSPVGDLRLFTSASAPRIPLGRLKEIVDKVKKDLK